MRSGEILVARGWIELKTVDFFADRWQELIVEVDKKLLVQYLQVAG